MNTSLTRLILAPALALTLLAMSSTAWAQGTATGPFTSHFVTPGPEVLVGDAANPIPIDLDPTGSPWFKSITDPNGLITSTTALSMTETILNVGTEPWFDWHQVILPNAAGVPSSTWLSVDLLINGSPITFSSTGLGTAILDVDTFSQPVLPGDILTIQNVVEVFPVPPPSTGAILRLQQFPTPEPASAGLIGLGALTLLGKRRSVR
jgi:hypothetical protein